MISQTGDWVGWVAISVLAIGHGGGLVDLALLFAAHHLPSAVLAPVAGPLVDRLDRRRVLVWAALAQAALTGFMVGAAALGAIAALQLLLVARSSILAFSSTAERAALPRVVDRDELLLAGSFDSATWSAVFALGMALGGALSALGPVLALAIDTLTFVMAARVFSRLPAMPPAAEIRSSMRGVASLSGDVREAVTYVWPRRELARAVFAKAPMAVAGGSTWLALHAIAADAASLGATALILGLLHGVRGVGTGVGPLIGAALAGGDRGARRNRVWHGLYAAGIVGMLAFITAGHWAIAIPAVLLWGMGVGANWVFSSEQIQRCAPDRLLGRLSALDSFAFTLAQTIAVVAAALIIDASGVASLGALPGIVIGSLIWLALDLRARTNRARRVLTGYAG